MFDSLFWLPNAFCLQDWAVKVLYFYAVFMFLFGCVALLPNDHSCRCRGLSNGSLMFARWSTCARSDGPGQFPAKPCWWSDWCWDEIEINGLSTMGRLIWHFLSCLSRFNSCLFHVISTYFHDPFIMHQNFPETERERERTSVRRVLTLKQCLSKGRWNPSRGMELSEENDYTIRSWPEQHPPVYVFVGPWQCVQFGFDLTKLLLQIAKDIPHLEPLSPATTQQLSPFAIVAYIYIPKQEKARQMLGLIESDCE